MPLPNLQDTLALYLALVEPLQTEKEFEVTEAKVLSFAEGAGRKVQKLLKQKVHKSPEWLHDWSMNRLNTYLEKRQSLVFDSSPVLYMPTKLYKTELEWCQVAARSIWAALNYRQMIFAGEIPTDEIGLDEYKQIYSTCRIPNNKVDQTRTFQDSRHIVVAFENAFYKLVVYEDNSILSENQLTKQLRNVISKDTKVHVAIGLLTTWDRDEWATSYTTLVEDAANKESFEIIESSLFVVCMDSELPQIDMESKAKVTKYILGNDSRKNTANRLYGKLQFVFNRNGIKSIIFERTIVRTEPIAALAQHILKHV